ncbi:hypothetical protein JOM56_003710 [Amanita muscaria]
MSQDKLSVCHTTSTSQYVAFYFICKSIALIKTYQAMQPTLTRWIRIVPKTTLAREKVLSALGPGQSKNRVSVMDLLEQKAAGDESWPRNIRMETTVKKAALQRVQADVRSRLKKLLRET